ncbi:MAG: radical SAM protein [Bacteroidetes bacterium]|nr:MAG: radical SAM protein [Bacteroidota bacterium]
MYNFPIQYEQPLFRPPSEARSLILQITSGCSWNKCAFCEMYASKLFKVKPFEDVQKEIEQVANSGYVFNKVFLADGDAMVLSAKKLNKILYEIKNKFRKVRRISVYARPSDFANKSLSELKELKSAGLDLAYVGAESGDDEVLRNINKGETFKSTIKGLLKAKEAGIKLSVMILNGLGGAELSRQHAVNSAKLINEIQPEYVSTLVLSMPLGEGHFKNRYAGKFTMLSKFELIEELGIFLKHSELKQSIFRSDHASNYLILKGILSKDKDLLISKIDTVLNHPQSANLREEFERGL